MRSEHRESAPVDHYGSQYANFQSEVLAAVRKEALGEDYGPGGRLLYTDPIVVTGWLSHEEMSSRSSIGFFLFFAPGVNERLLDTAGFEVSSVQERTQNMASMAGRWRAARAKRADDLRATEGVEAFEGQQTFFDVTARLASERRLSRFAFLARKR